MSAGAGSTSYADLKSSIMDTLIDAAAGDGPARHPDPTTIGDELGDATRSSASGGLDPRATEPCTALGERDARALR